MLLDEFNPIDMREICTHILDLNHKLWIEYAFNSDNLIFFDGVTTYKNLPKDFHNQVKSSFSKSAKKSEFNNEKWELLRQATFNIVNGELQTKISLTKKQISYFKGLEKMIQTIIHQNDRNVYMAILHLFDASLDLQRTFFIDYLTDKVNDIRTHGNIAPDVN